MFAAPWDLAWASKLYLSDGNMINSQAHKSSLFFVLTSLQKSPLLVLTEYLVKETDCVSYSDTC